MAVFSYSPCFGDRGNDVKPSARDPAHVGGCMAIDPWPGIGHIDDNLRPRHSTVTVNGCCDMHARIGCKLAHDQAQVVGITPRLPDGAQLGELPGRGN